MLSGLLRAIAFVVAGTIDEQHSISPVFTNASGLVFACPKLELCPRPGLELELLMAARILPNGISTSRT